MLRSALSPTLRFSLTSINLYANIAREYWTSTHPSFPFWNCASQEHPARASRPEKSLFKAYDKPPTALPNRPALSHSPLRALLFHYSLSTNHSLRNSFVSNTYTNRGHRTTVPTAHPTPRSFTQNSKPAYRSLTQN
jgi:hypothetical protein